MYMRIMISILLAITLCACDLFNRQPTLQIKLESESNANSGMATAVDIVFVYDDQLVSMLPKTSTNWFMVKPVLLSNHAAVLDVLHVEVPVGMPLHHLELPARHRQAKYVISYAHYLSAKGQYPVNLTSFKCVVITLAEERPLYAECR